jgi:hypothetical protein
MIHSAVEGKAYYEDENNTISNANVELVYNRINAQNISIVEEEILVGTTTTDSNGKYAFTDLMPGEYNLTITKGDVYSSFEQISINENETLSHNVSLELVPVTTTGYTEYNGEIVGGIPIKFGPDASVENNTVQNQQVNSDEDGFYLINLIPGSYNVTVEKKDSQGQVLIYSFVGKLELQQAEGTKSYDISLAKNSTTVSGYTSYAGANVINITNIKFVPDGAVANNTAVYSKTISSNAAGYYTVELSPGSYNISVNHPFNESGKNYSYTFEGQKDITSIEPPITYNIAMSRVERD